MPMFRLACGHGLVVEVVLSERADHGDVGHLAGIVHRFESRNAFFACHAGHDVRTRHLVLSCESCGRIAEVDGNKAFAAIDKAAASAGFSPEGAVVEVRGRCADCADAPEEAAV